MRSAACGEYFISVAIEDAAPSDWDAQVFEPDIVGKAETLVVEPLRHVGTKGPNIFTPSDRLLPSAALYRPSASLSADEREENEPWRL